jgi:O-antigen ligase
VTAAVVKSLCGIYFIYGVVRPDNLFVEYTTSHSDTLLYVAVLAGLVAYFFERPRASTLRKALWWLPIVLLGMKLNDRRLAYVSLGGSLLAIYALQPNTWLKRRIFQLVMVALPVAVLYVSVGWNRGEGLFAPAQMVKSLIVGDPTAAGADYRDIENADVISTWADHALVPLGFGHKFHEPVKLPDISRVMPTYQFHPHNQLLWMWAIGGVLGFTLMFAPWVVGLFLAARAHRFSKEPFVRASALTCIALIIAHLNQVYGDMGTRTHFGSVLGGLAVAVAAKLAVRSGAWR